MNENVNMLHVDTIELFKTIAENKNNIPIESLTRFNSNIFRYYNELYKVFNINNIFELKFKNKSKKLERKEIKIEYLTLKKELRLKRKYLKRKNRIKYKISKISYKNEFLEYKKLYKLKKITIFSYLKAIFKKKETNY